MYIYLQFCSYIVVLGLKRLRQLAKSLDCVRLQEIIIVQMIKQDIETLVGVFDLLSKRRRCFLSNSLHIVAENFD